ncbi:hypothetical protein [Paraburkholderia sp. GAS334]|uniref:hypothetical protein n=1 Tax=Paraburkholderia sp. GAS334 TaxID=3035131 RepID=UPI003D1F4919
MSKRSPEEKRAETRHDRCNHNFAIAPGRNTATKPDPPEHGDQNQMRHIKTGNGADNVIGGRRAKSKLVCKSQNIEVK